jgi:GNAT superfamily N-acetyltransferase
VALSITGLDKAAHDRAAFSCGREELDDFLRTKAVKHQAQRVSRTFVLVDDAEPRRILGYYSLSNSQIAREDITPDEAKALPRHPIPGVMLARLAIAAAEQGKSYGTWLLMDALKRTALISQDSGVYALVVDAIDETAKRFYLRFGFIPITDRPMTLYLPLKTALHAISNAQPREPAP